MSAVAAGWSFVRGRWEFRFTAGGCSYGYETWDALVAAAIRRLLDRKCPGRAFNMAKGSCSRLHPPAAPPPAAMVQPDLFAP